MPCKLAILFAVCLAVATRVVAAEAAPKPSPQQILDAFSRNWDDSTWRPKLFRGGYMRPLDDAGWKARMRALRDLVRQGKAAIPVLVSTLKAGDVPQRILAAQALGYLAPDAPIDVLLRAARSDSHAAVRLYAVDSLGMQGKPAAGVDWKALADREQNRDVKKHIQYARARQGAPVSREIVDRLKNWDPERIDSAVVGKPAPEFVLQSAQGKTVRLSDFKGKKAVVLVFIYGDT